MFCVFSLPRSRSAWLSAFLSTERGVGHDIGLESASVADFLERADALGGICETGAAFAWPLIREMRPRWRIAVIKRPAEDVCESLRRLGFQGIEAEIAQRAADLDEIAAHEGVLSVNYADLANPAACGGLFAHCLDEPMRLERWKAFDGLKIEVDLARTLQKLTANRERVAALKAEVRRRLAPPGYWIGLEPWSAAWWTEAKPLAERHFEEVDGGVEENRPMKLDEAFMQRLADGGVLKLITARLDGRLVGYYTWNVSLDVESEGLLIAQQGAWYVAPGHPRLAHRMFDAAVRELRAIGVQCLYPHHRTQGRGANLGRFFKRRGAKETQHTYSLWIAG